jgi:hypothetical protein
VSEQQVVSVISESYPSTEIESSIAPLSANGASRPTASGASGVISYETAEAELEFSVRTIIHDMIRSGDTKCRNIDFKNIDVNDYDDGKKSIREALVHFARCAQSDYLIVGGGHKSYGHVARYCVEYAACNIILARIRW